MKVEIQTTSYTLDDGTVQSIQNARPQSSAPQNLVFYRFACCGLGELGGIYDSTPQEVLSKMWRLCLTKGCVIFTYVLSASKGPKQLAEFIADNNLGVVTELPRFVNPNTTHTIVTYAWNVDRHALIRWAEAQLQKENKVKTSKQEEPCTSS